MFRRVHNVVWDLMTGRVGIVNESGIVSGVVTGEEEKTVSVEVNVLDDFTYRLPAYAIRVPLSQVKVGDILSTEHLTGFVEKVNEKSLNIRKVNGQLTTGYTPPKVNISFSDGDVMVVRSLLSFGESESEGQSFLGNLQQNPIVMMAIMKGDDFGKLDDIMPLLLMSGLNQGATQSAGANNFAQTLLTMQLLKGEKGGKTDDLLPLLMLGGQGFGGQGNNPLSTILMLKALKGDSEIEGMFDGL